jgi:hypothetical protein
MGRCRNMALATTRNLSAFDEQINYRRIQDGGKRHEQPWRCVAGHSGSIGDRCCEAVRCSNCRHFQ